MRGRLVQYGGGETRPPPPARSRLRSVLRMAAARGHPCQSIDTAAQEAPHQEAHSGEALTNAAIRQKNTGAAVTARRRRVPR